MTDGDTADVPTMVGFIWSERYIHPAMRAVLAIFGVFATPSPN